MNNILLYAAVFPVAVLCYYIYKKDVNKEPGLLLAKIFALGFFSAIPILFVEVLLSIFFHIESGTFLEIFIGTFFSVAIVEEGFKWFITKLVGFDNEEFDEIYDIIVYAVFASLGFACIENIMYVLRNGIGNAVLRAIVSVPGHTCFGVLMGFFFAEAKIANMNQNEGLYTKNIYFSILVPTIFHTLFDAILLYAASAESILYVIIFFIFDICMVIYCFTMVNRVSKIQKNISNKVKDGSIMDNGNGKIIYNNSAEEVNFCPICGKDVAGFRYCPSCGLQLEMEKNSS